MLAASELELLTGYVDGELSARDRRRADRLLRSNPEARELLARLQADAQALRQLPRLPIPIDLRQRVQTALARQQPKSPTLRFPAPRRRVPLNSWISLGAAAAMLFLVGLVSFFLHTPFESDETATPHRLAQVAPEHPSASSVRPLLPLARPARQPNSIIAQNTPQSAPVPSQVNLEESLDEDARLPELLPMPLEEVQGPVLTSGDREKPAALERVEVDLPTILRLHQLDRSAVEQLGNRLRQGTAFRIELLAHDAAGGLERLRAALAQIKIQPILHPLAAARLARPTWRTDFAVFVENLKPTDVIAVLQAVGSADRKPEPRFEGTLLVKLASLWDRRELRYLIGLDPIQVRPAPAIPVTEGVDIRRPLSDITTQQVTNALDGKGVPRPGTHTGNCAYVAPLGLPRGNPAELKRFLDSRRPPQPGTIQIMLVVRNVGS